MSISNENTSPDEENVTLPIRQGAAAADPRDSSGLRHLLLVGSCAAVVLLGVLFGLRTFFADSTPPMSEEALQAALEQWEARGPASYDLDVQIGGAQPGVAHIEVRNGEVEAATRDGLALQEWNKDEWSIPMQFEALERELEFQQNPQQEMDAPPGAKLWLRCEFDPTYGYPLRFHRHATGGAPEVFWRNSLQPK